MTTPPWNGLPDQPERSGWVVVDAVRPMMIWWNADKQTYGNKQGNTDYLPEKIKYSGYMGRFWFPPELAQMRKDERERCLTIAVDEQWNFPSNPSIQTHEATVAYNACQRIIDKIRNLGAAS